MLILVRLLFLLGAVFLSANCVTVRDENESDKDLVTPRASVRIINEHGGEWAADLISSNLVYTPAHIVLHADGNEKQSLYVIPLADGNRTIKRKVKKIFHGSYFRNNSTIPDCKTAGDKCVEECVVYKNQPEHHKYEIVNNYALLLLEKPLPLCGRIGDAVAARLDVVPLPHSQKELITDSEEECFMVDRFGEVAVLEKVYPFVSEEAPECEVQTIVLERANDTHYKKPSKFERHGAGETQCIPKDGTTVQVKFIPTIVYSNGKREGLSTHKHAAELIAVITAWGELDNYMHAHCKCSAFLQKYPYDSVKEKYLKTNP